MKNTILDIDHDEVNKFFLNQDSYITTEIPPYYRFNRILSLVSKKMNGSTVMEKRLEAAKKNSNVNHVIYGNKNGKYEWRKFELIHPVLYISLINTLTSEESWKTIRDRFEEIGQNSSIECMSIPVLPRNKQKQKASQITEWVESMEKESIKLSLDYEYLFQTDISNCYGSIYTHSISWALHGKEVAKNNRRYKDLLGNRIDCHLQAMSYGQTNGIPLGSQVMNFIAEIVLAYADEKLSEKIGRRIKKGDYHILRYRDDYRIFVRTPYNGEFIMKALSEILIDLGMTLSAKKTIRSEKIVIDSIKPGKIASYHELTPKVFTHHSLRKELLMIYEFGTKFPHSRIIDKRLEHVLKATAPNILQDNYEEIVAILTNIVFENPNSFPVAAALISKAIYPLKKGETRKILDKLFRKIHLLPNSGILEIWLQRITAANKVDYPYYEKLCSVTKGDKVSLFNSEWIISDSMKQIVEETLIVDPEEIENLDRIIENKEVELYRPY